MNISEVTDNNSQNENQEVPMDVTETEAPSTNTLNQMTDENKAIKSDDSCFKEPQLISVYMNNRNKARNASNCETINRKSLSNECSPSDTPPEDTSDDSIKPENSKYKYSDQPSCSTTTNAQEDTSQRVRVNLYARDTKPQMYVAKGNLVTRSLLLKNLPKVYQYLPTTGKPGPNTSLEEFYKSKIRDFVGCLTDEEFTELASNCSPDHLKTGKEIKMQTSVPVTGLLHANILHDNFTLPDITTDPPNLVILKKNKLRLENDSKGVFFKKLKYRGIRMLPPSQTDNQNAEDPASSIIMEPNEELEPGVDILFRVRMYRPYPYNIAKDRFTRGRHSVFCCDVVLTGRHTLAALRDRFVCHNDFDLRVDVSHHPDMLPPAKAKEVFPSGFLFINNVFYVDTREGCIDYSAPIREWALKKNLGRFPKRDMCQVRLDQLVLKLGYPEVYVHQGNCEHVFLFSEVRLLGPGDATWLSRYPCSTAIGQNQTVYCTTCAEFSAKWIVVGSERVPFDPGFFCDTCFKQYMYKDGQKIGNFKAYRYRGNALNVLKPL